MKFTPFLLALAAVPAASAADYFINDPQYGSPANAMFGAKYRLSHANFDMSLDAGGGTFAGNFISANLGNNTLLSTLTWDFSLEHVLAEGYVFKMTRTDTGATTTLSWGAFTTPPGGTTAALINGETPYTSDGGKPTKYNSLFIEAIANPVNGPVVEQVNFSKLAFTSPTLNYGGGSFFSGSAPANTTQLLSATDNLANHAWKLTGTVSAKRDATVGGDELVKFVIDGKTAVFTPVPEASTVVGGLALAGLVGAAAFRRLRTR